MKETNQIQQAFSSASTRLLWLSGFGVLLLMVTMLVLVVTFKGSVDRFEKNLRYQPPMSAGGSQGRLFARLAKKQKLYVPVYSHVYIHDGVPFHLTATLSIRNTDAANPLFVESVRYYDSAGKLIRQYLDQPIEIAPHATSEFLVEERDTRGGSGANFVVEWATENPLTQPVVEAVMIGASGQQGISFICSAVVISEDRLEEIGSSGIIESGSSPKP